MSEDTDMNSIFLLQFEDSISIRHRSVLLCEFVNCIKNMNHDVHIINC
jgi:hypothetical protein